MAHVPAHKARETVRRLRSKLAQLQASWRHRTAGIVPTGFAALDEVLPSGGLPSGAITEILQVEPGTGALCFALHVAHRAAGRRGSVVVIDTQGDFYPPAAFAIGLQPRQLLVVRARRASEAVWALEQVLRCRGVRAAIASLARLDARGSRRMQLAAEVGGTLGLIVRAAETAARTFAAVQLQIEPRILAAGDVAYQITVLKTRQGRPVDPVVIELGHEAGTLFAHAVPCDRAGPSDLRVVCA